MRAPSRRGRERADGIVDGEGDVADAVAVPSHVLGDLRLGAQPAGDNEAHGTLLEDVRRPVVDTRLGAAVRDDVEAERRREERRCVTSVADPQLDVVEIEQSRRCGGVTRRARIERGHDTLPVCRSSSRPRQKA
jgi:hypothetical protein